MTTPVDKEKIEFDFTVASTTISQLEELLHPEALESERERDLVHHVVERSLEIIQDQFYLIPKVILEDDKLVTRAVPAEAITEPLYELWNSVSI